MIMMMLKKIAPRTFLYMVSIIITTFVSGAMFGSMLSERSEAVFYGSVNLTSAILLSVAFMKFLSNSYYEIIDHTKLALLHVSNPNA